MHSSAAVTWVSLKPTPRRARLRTPMTSCSSSLTDRIPVGPACRLTEIGEQFVDAVLLPHPRRHGDPDVSAVRYAHDLAVAIGDGAALLPGRRCGDRSLHVDVLAPVAHLEVWMRLPRHDRG